MKNTPFIRTLKRFAILALLILPPVAGGSIGARLSYQNRPPLPKDIPWWVLCQVSSVSGSDSQRLCLVDWRRVIAGEPNIKPFGEEEPLAVGALIPICTPGQMMDAEGALCDLNANLQYGAWSRGPAEVDVQCTQEQIKLTFSLDDYGTYRTSYECSSGDKVVMRRADLAASPMWGPPEYVARGLGDVVRGVGYGILASIVLFMLVRAGAEAWGREIG